MLDDYLVNLLHRLETDFAPQVLDIGAAIARTDALGNLIVGLLWLLLALIFWAMSNYTARKQRKMSEWSTERDMLLGVTWTLRLVMLVPLFIGLNFICDPWLWTGLFNPRLRFAHDLYNLVLNAPHNVR